MRRAAHAPFTTPACVLTCTAQHESELLRAEGAGLAVGNGQCAQCAAATAQRSGRVKAKARLSSDAWRVLEPAPKRGGWRWLLVPAQQLVAAQAGCSKVSGWRVFPQARLAPTPSGWVIAKGHENEHAQQPGAQLVPIPSDVAAMAVAHRAVIPHLGSLARSSTTSSASWGMRSGHSHTAAPRLRRVAACGQACASEAWRPGGRLPV